MDVVIFFNRDYIVIRVYIDICAYINVRINIIIHAYKYNKNFYIIYYILFIYILFAH